MIHCYSNLSSKNGILRRHGASPNLFPPSICHPYSAMHGQTLYRKWFMHLSTDRWQPSVGSWALLKTDCLRPPTIKSVQVPAPGNVDGAFQHSINSNVATVSGRRPRFQFPKTAVMACWRDSLLGLRIQIDGACPRSSYCRTFWALVCRIDSADLLIYWTPVSWLICQRAWNTNNVVSASS